MKYEKFDIAVIGGGPAGCMAAIRAAQLGRRVVLIERNDCIGKKLGLTGNRRCNFTNTASLEDFLSRFSPGGEFYRTAFQYFLSEQLRDLLRAKGLESSVQSPGKVFPVDNTAQSVVSALREYLKEAHVQFLYNTRVQRITKENGLFFITAGDAVVGTVSIVILAMGGKTYSSTGSSGDGFRLAEDFGHHCAPAIPGLVPLRVKEPWVKGLQGISLESVRLMWYRQGKKVVSDKGSVLFTHYGVSGPLVLDVSRQIVESLGTETMIGVEVDLVPDMKREELSNEFVENHSDKDLNIGLFLSRYGPKRLSETLLSLLKVEAVKPLHQISKEDRNRCVKMMKALPLTITGPLSLDDAMVTAGGVIKKEIDPRTMESRLVPGLYFAGEIIEGCGPSGGYNIQQAFSTGFLAGESAAKKESCCSEG